MRQPSFDSRSPLIPPSRVSDTVWAAETPDGIEFILHPAGLSARIAAYLIDACIQGLISAGVGLALVLAAKITGNWLLMLVYFGITWFYYVLFDLLWQGQSPGKRIIGLRVVRSDGSPIDAGASFLRNLLRSADAFLSLSIIGFLCTALSPGFRRLGDWAADTLVIYTLPSFSPERSTLSALEGRAPSFPPRRLSYEEKQAILAFARRYPVLGRERSEELAAPYVGFLCRDERLQGKNEAGAADYLLSIAVKLNGGLV